MQLIRTEKFQQPGERLVGIHRYLTCDPRVTDANVNRLESIIGDPWGCGDYDLWQNALEALVDNRPSYWTVGNDESDRAFIRVANQLSLSVALACVNEDERFWMLRSLVPVNILAMDELGKELSA